MSKELVLKCPGCRQLNRIKQTAEGQRHICGKCWSLLDLPSPDRSATPPSFSKARTQRTRPSKVARWVVAALIAWAVAWYLMDSNPPRKSASSYSPSRAGNAKLPPYPAHALPYNGEVRVSSFSPRVAPLDIQASSDSHYLVKLVDAYSKVQVMTVFVRKGMKASVDVPLGSYEFRYAAGERWYGYEHFFGPETGYSKADKVFDFRNTGNSVSGYTVTLYKVPHGNLHTSGISASAF